MMKTLYGTVIYPQGVEQVAVGIRNVQGARDCLLGKAKDVFQLLGHVRDEYAGAKQIPMRIYDVSNACAFHFEEFLQDEFGNVMAVYSFTSYDYNTNNGSYEINKKQ